MIDQKRPDDIKVEIKELHSGGQLVIQLTQRNNYLIQTVFVRSPEAMRAIYQALKEYFEAKP